MPSINETHPLPFEKINTSTTCVYSCNRHWPTMTAVDLTCGARQWYNIASNGSVTGKSCGNQALSRNRYSRNTSRSLRTVKYLA